MTGGEIQKPRPLIIFVSVATEPPYPELYDCGPKATWIRDSEPDVQVYSVSGYPPRKGQRFLSDIREALRYRDIDPSRLVSVRPRSVQVRALRALYVTRKQGSGDFPSSRLASRSATILTTLLVSLVRWYDRWVLGFSRNGVRKEIKVTGRHLIANRPSVLGAFLAIQLDLLSWLRKEYGPADALFVTASAYVDVSRFVEWVKTKDPNVFFGGSTPKVSDSSDDPFLSGFCQFVSWEGISRLLHGTKFRFDLSNDEALTRWLVEHGYSWEDPGIVWNTDQLDSGRCPLCLDRRASVVRCTRHFDRSQEADLMRRLHHSHA